jgi:23S rRNA (guanosine2251-2'-O)-methyltransferase
MKEQEQIYGIRAILEALQAGKELDRVYAQQGLKGSLFRELEAALKKSGVRLSYVPKERMARLTRENHQGVIAQLSPIAYRDYKELIDETISGEGTPLFLLLDGVSDVRNLGAIIRTASCTGVHGLILPDTGSAPINADTVKTSAGAVFQLPVARCRHLKDAIFYLQASGIQVVGASEKAHKTIFEIDVSGPVALLMGSEGSGISPALLKSCDAQGQLPMKGPIASLNVSVACGVMLYEVVRQRGV